MISPYEYISAIDRVIVTRALAPATTLARTIADLTESETITAPHVAEALQYRAHATRRGRSLSDEAKYRQLC
ncbi:MAG TPA: hypothetical protein VFW17_21650 [Ktedonobacterales bacterium]|nr:hypothetical protein [Ktedonobacterales bacterium]